jgi:hypothetical protein
MKEKKPKTHKHQYTRKYMPEQVDHIWLGDNNLSFNRERMQFVLDVCKCGKTQAADLIPINRDKLKA